MTTAKAQAAGSLPYAVALGDGRTLVVELPRSEYEHDADGELLLRPAGLRRLDRARVVASDVPDSPSPGWIKVLRLALGMTQAEFGDAINVDKLTVSRWERGQVKPGLAAVRALRKLRRSRAARGVVVCG